MSKCPQGRIVRRQFLKGAAVLVPQAAAAQKSDDHQQNHDHQVLTSDIALRVKALESLLIEKGMVDPAPLGAVVDAYERKIGPRNGARVVHEPGLIRHIDSVCWPTARQPSQS